MEKSLNLRVGTAFELGECQRVKCSSKDEVLRLIASGEADALSVQEPSFWAEIPKLEHFAIRFNDRALGEEAREFVMRGFSLVPLQSYKTLADAAHLNPRYGIPGIEIWYAKNMRDLNSGLDFLREEKPEAIPTRETFEQSHVFIGNLGLAPEERDQAYMLMQGEVWSPNGEARDMIRALGVHTSMSVGDLLRIGTTLFFVDREGLVELEA